MQDYSFMKENKKRLKSTSTKVKNLWIIAMKISKLEQENYFKEKKEVINKPIIPTTLGTDWFTIFYFLEREREIFSERKRRK